MAAQDHGEQHRFSRTAKLALAALAVTAAGFVLTTVIGPSRGTAACLSEADDGIVHSIYVAGYLVFPLVSAALVA